jgi:hypothetical protein
MRSYRVYVQIASRSQISLQAASGVSIPWHWGRTAGTHTMISSQRAGTQGAHFHVTSGLGDVEHRVDGIFFLDGPVITRKNERRSLCGRGGRSKA